MEPNALPAAASAGAQQPNAPSSTSVAASLAAGDAHTHTLTHTHTHDRAEGSGGDDSMPSIPSAGSASSSSHAQGMTALRLVRRGHSVPASCLGKSACRVCVRRHTLYCHSCHIPLPITDDLPKVRLPLKVDILRDDQENEKKSTSTHAVVLAPEDARVWVLPDFPVYADARKVLLLFPSPVSKAAKELPDLSQFTHVMVVDCTWQRGASIMSMPEIADAPFTHVHIHEYHTLFWRYQSLGPQCLSTIEATYYFLREFEVERRRRELLAVLDAGASLPADAPVRTRDDIIAVPPADPAYALYDGAFDDLLSVFLATYHRIQESYADAAKTGKKFTTRMREGYIQADAAGAPASDESHAAAVASESQRRPKHLRGAWAVRADLLDVSAAATLRKTTENYLRHTAPKGQRADNAVDMAGGAVKKPRMEDPAATSGDDAAGDTEEAVRQAYLRRLARARREAEAAAASSEVRSTDADADGTPASDA